MKTLPLEKQRARTHAIRLILTTLSVLALLAAGAARAASPLCASAGMNQNYEWVSRVSISGNSVAIPKTGYRDTTATALATLQAGQSYAVEVDVRTDGTTYDEYVKFWFDLNQDGAISDPAELVYDQNASFASFRTFTGTISIPSSAYNGPMYVRMIMQYAATPALCGNYTYGTTVDLLVNVTGATANPTAPAAPTSVTAVAGNGSATVSFSPSASTGVTGYDVVSSPGGVVASGSASPITVNGLTNGTTYTFTVLAKKSATVFSEPSSPSNAVTPQSVVNGACGADSGTSRPSAPSQLCASGSASAVTAGNTAYDWSCSGTNGGTTASCSATRLYAVTTTVASGSGSVSASQNVAFNATPAITVTPASGWAIQSVTGCGGSLSGNTYVVAPVAAACTVSATFVAVVNGACGSQAGAALTAAPTQLCASGSASAITAGNTAYDWSCGGTNGGTTASCNATRLYRVTTTVTGNGSIGAARDVAFNATPVFTVTPQAGHLLQSVTGCGGTLSGNTYTVAPVTAACTVSATFVANTPPAALSVSLAGAGGTIRFGDTVTGRYAFADGQNDPEDTSGGGTTYRFVRSADASVATTGDNVAVATGATGGADRTYTVQAADVGQYLFYCVTPKASAGDLTGTESCSPVLPAIARATQSLTPGTLPALLLGRSGTVSVTGGASGLPVVLASQTPTVCTVAGNVVTAVEPGRCTLVASQEGDARYEAPAPVTLSMDIGRLAPELVLVATPAIVNYRAPAVLVLDARGSYGDVTGEIDFHVGDQPIPGCARVALTKGRATCTSNRLPVGRQAVVARFPGDAHYEAAASAPLAVDVKTTNPAARNRNAMGDGRTAIFYETAGGGLSIQTVNANAPSDGQQLLPPDSGWHVVGFADFDGTGSVDIVLRHEDGRFQLWALDGIGVASQVDLAGMPAGASVAAIADFDGDGKDDLLVKLADGSLAIWAMSGPDVLSRTPIAGGREGVAFLATADLDGDGSADLVLSTATGIRLQRIAGTRAAERADFPMPGSGFRLAHTGDFDGDGRSDLVFEGPAGEVAIWRLDGLDIVQRATIRPPSGWRVTDVVDFDGNFTDELVLGGPGGDIQVWYLDRALQPSSVTTHHPQGDWQLRQVADVDGDGSPDFVLVSAAGEVKAWLFRNGLYRSEVVISHATPWSVIP